LRPKSSLKTLYRKNGTKLSWYGRGPPQLRSRSSGLQESNVMQSYIHNVRYKAKALSIKHISKLGDDILQKLQPLMNSDPVFVYPLA
jgi:hypothetical protein